MGIRSNKPNFAFILFLVLSACNQVTQVSKTIPSMIAPTPLPSYTCATVSEYTTQAACEASTFAHCDNDLGYYPNGSLYSCFKPVAAGGHCFADHFSLATTWLYTPYGVVSYDPVAGTFVKNRNLIGCSSADCVCTDPIQTALSYSSGISHFGFDSNIYSKDADYLIRFNMQDPNDPTVVPAPTTHTSEAYMSYPVITLSTTAVANLANTAAPDNVTAASQTPAPFDGSTPQWSSIKAYWTMDLINGDGSISGVGSSPQLTPVAQATPSDVLCPFLGGQLCPATVTTHYDASQQVGNHSVLMNPKDKISYSATLNETFTSFTVSFWIKPMSSGAVGATSALHDPCGSDTDATETKLNTFYGSGSEPYLPPGKDYFQWIGAGWNAFLFHVKSDCTIKVGTDEAHAINRQSTDHDGYLSANTWQQIVFSFQSGTLLDGSSSSTMGVGRLYKNGLLLKAQDMNNPTTFASFMLSDPTNYRNSINGAIDDVAIWGSALDSSEVAKLFTTQQTLTRKFTKTTSIGGSDRQAMSLKELKWQTNIPMGKELSKEVDQNSASSYSAAKDFSTGLLHAWHFNEDNSAVKFQDSIGSLHLNMYGPIERSKAGVLNSAVGFTGKEYSYYSGITNYTLTPLTGVPIGNAPRTVAGWFRTSSANYNRLFSYGGPSNYFVISTKVSTSGASIGQGRLYVSTQVGTDVESIGPDVTDGRWHHFAVVYDGNLIAVYIDGVTGGVTPTAVGSIATSISSTGNQLYFGTMTSGSGSFSGDIDEFAIWSRAISSADISDLYSRSSSQVKMQIRTCPDSACSGVSWIGSNSTNLKYFSELTSPNFDTLAHTADAPKFDLNQAPFVQANLYPYYQAQITYESFDIANSGTITPSMSAISLTPNPYYRGYATISNSTPIVYTDTSLLAFGEKLGATGCAAGVKYQLSCDAGTSWFYLSNSAWTAVTASDDTQTSTALQINSSISNFATSTNSACAGVKSLVWRAYLRSDGGAPCTLDAVDVLNIP